MRHEWLDSVTQHAYVDVPLADVDRLVRMAIRVASAHEPEPVDAVLARVHVPVTVILGGVRTPAGPTPAELDALVRLAVAPRMLVVEGTAHFIHEEAPDELAALLHPPLTVARRTAGAHR